LIASARRHIGRNHLRGIGREPETLVHACRAGKGI
jgi:hypothetical protein